MGENDNSVDEYVQLTYLLHFVADVRTTNTALTRLND